MASKKGENPGVLPTVFAGYNTENAEITISNHSTWPNLHAHSSLEWMQCGVIGRYL